MIKSTIAAALLSIAVIPTFAQTASVAPTAPSNATFAKTHPRRAEVNQRLANQNRRIKAEVAEGEIGKAKAAKLHKEDRQIRHEEHAMASQDGGHVTKGEQKVLNHQENKVSRQIGS